MYSRAPKSASVVVPTRNGLPLLRYTLESLKHQLSAAYEVIVVDDASEDGTAAWLATYRPSYRLKTLRNEHRLGRSMTRNRGISAASGDIVLFVDGDTICPPPLVAVHLRLHADGEAEGAETCITGYPWFWRSVATWSFGQQPEGPLLDPALLSRWEEFERWAGGPLGEPATPVAVARQDAAPFVWCITRSLSVRRSVAVGLGGFDERFKGYGWEDFEFGYRLAARGIRIVAHPDAAVFHQTHPISEVNDAEFHRNYGIFLELHPDFDVALITLCPSTTDGRYQRLCAAYQRARRLAPTLAAAVREVFVDYALARHKRQPNPLRGWIFWAERWGKARCRQLKSEQLVFMGDIDGRHLTSMFRDVSGCPDGDWGGMTVGRLRKHPWPPAPTGSGGASPSA